MQMQAARRRHAVPAVVNAAAAAVLAQRTDASRIWCSVQVPEYLKKDCLLFYYPDCEQLAKRIVECSDGTVELAEINWK